MEIRTLPSLLDNHSNPYALLAEYSITSNGFLPSHRPLPRLVSPYYDRWETIVSELPKLIAEGKLREEVNDLPILSLRRLQEETEWRRAYVVLAFITHGYIWGGDKPSEILPPAISVPFIKASEHFHLPPVATYSALNLWNFSTRTSDDYADDFTDLDSLEVNETMTGTDDEAWFYLISVAVEAQGAPALPMLLRAMEFAKRRDQAMVTQLLQELVPIVHRLGRTLMRMSERCDPVVFFHKIRPFLAGSKNMAAAGLPRGVYYDQGNGKGEWMQVRGGSNAQSSLIQFFDAALGVRHDMNGEVRNLGPQPSFHDEMRDYMPGPHRKFLEHVVASSTIQDFALLSETTPEQTRLLEAYRAALKALSDFRALHLQIITKYIIIPAKQSKAIVATNLASASIKKAGLQGNSETEASFTGTGGTDLVPFLKRTRAETEEAGRFPICK